MKLKFLIAVFAGVILSAIAYSLVKDMVTAISIGVILGFFSYFFQEIICLIKADSHLKKIDDDNLLGSLSNDVLNGVINDYKHSINIDVDGSKKSNIPSLEYLNLQTIAKVYKVNLKALDSASGVLVGLGLMGTFLGLTIGIANFDSSNSEQIHNSIQTLLNGMYIAFLTSLVGMGSSIIHTGLDKHWKNVLQLRIKDITDKLDKAYYIDDMQLLEYKQHKMLEFTDEDGNSVSMSSAIGHILEENKAQSEALCSFSTDLSTKLNNSLGEQIDQKLSPIFNNVIEHIDKMAETVVSPANEMMEKVAGELKESMALVVKEFKDKVSDTATVQLESISQSLSSASKAIDQLPDNVANAVNTMQVAVADVQKTMLKLTEDIMSKQADLLALQESTTTESNNLIDNLKLGVEKLGQVNDSFKYTIGAFHQSQEQISNSIAELKEISGKMHDAVGAFQSSQSEYAENMKELQIQSHGSINSVSQLVSHSGELSKEYASQFVVIKEGLTEIFEKLKEGLEEYSKTMQQTTQDYLQQYSQSLTDTADSLKTSIDIMNDTISDFSEVIEKSKE